MPATAHHHAGRAGDHPHGCGPGLTAGATTQTNADPIMSTEPADLYAVLGVTPQASQDQINHAYRALVRQHHPDSRAPGTPSQDAGSDAALQCVFAAHTVLSNPARRAQYDQELSARPRPVTPRRRQDTPKDTAPPSRPPIIAGPVRWHRLR
jgi:hypothetical protein